MGRSVSTPSGATVVAYEQMNLEDDSDSAFEWEWIVEDAAERITNIFPSMTPDDSWLGREDHVLMSNCHAKFGVSEYCGLIAFWLVPEENGLAEAWVDRIERKFDATFGSLKKIGTASNGESFFERLAS